ncbi:putative integral membrane protein; putative transcription factor [Beutenbergia cavernae DSM 12333]|uniref:Putative integral membrane protein putative transcription factor n=1 Tax=Beutenbergia cavernae (strain ATCC BAA-8 / DSM 12333 / CCUG 43141 / JCM 11478 / NBRC 16432 / NCIMB 13614 / HKI 0122) TaxID=471853 RepID=C5C1J1_BEUC1|nr:hypothetical protein [Beutenbergia cavernae]ACQ81601.1 putative integral membrane protein; putative transcription factor [Beutenbergia cavernae DSM 12333]
MILGLVTAFAAAVCYGVGSVLQAVAARGTDAVEGLDPRLLVRLARSWRYLLGVGLDALGFALSLVAVRTLPLFVVQSIVASFLAITAVLGALFLAMPLRRADRIGLTVVVAGLVLVGSSASEDSAVEVVPAEQWGVLAAALLLAVLAIPLGRVPGPRGAAALGGVAGLAFGATAVASRMLPGAPGGGGLLAEIEELIASPALYALAVAAVVALLTYSIALQRGSVTQATAPLVVGETVAPALVGVLLLGDRPRAGWEWAAILGFVLSVSGAVALARHGEVEAPAEDPTDAPDPGTTSPRAP